MQALGLDWLPTPEVPFNLLTAPEALRPTPLELIAGPYGLLLFLPLAPLLRLMGRWHRFAAFASVPLLWNVLTLGPLSTGILYAGSLLGAVFAEMLRRMYVRGIISTRVGIALIWIGLNALALPLWWQASWGWYTWTSSMVAPLHQIGAAYILLRLIAFGVDLLRAPERAPRWDVVVAWLFYPPITRLGPILFYQQFAERYDRWRHDAPFDAKTFLRHFGMGCLGGVTIGVCNIALIPQVPALGADYFARPQDYTTAQLITLIYAISVMVYCMLWSYSRFARAAGHACGLEVPPNFDELPKADSVRDFWRRWNICVGYFIREYIYIPLGGRYAPPLFVFGVAFLYCGVWHGAAPSFLIWPLIPIVSLVLQRHWDRYRKRRWGDQASSRTWRVFCWVLTMHVGVLTVITFADFERAGVRLWIALGERFLGLFAG